MEQYSSTRYRAWIVFLLFSGTLINAFDRASLSISAPTLIKELGMTPTEMGVVLSSFFWPYLICNIFAGSWADKFGAKRVMGWAAFIWSVFSALTGLAHDKIHLIIARIGVGAGESASFPVNAKVVNNSFPSEQRGVVTGIYTAGLRMGFAVCPLMMAFLLTHWGWRFAFITTGIASLVWVAMWFFSYKESKSEAQKKGPAQKVPWGRLLRQRGMYGLLLAKFFQDYLLYFFVTWLPGYLIIEHGFTTMQMGTYDSVMWLCGFASQPLIGMFSDYLIRRGVSVTAARKGCIVVMMLMASLVIGVGFTKSFTICISLLIVAVACESAGTTMLWTICTELAPRKFAGRIAGVMNAAGALAGICAPLITGAILHVTGSFSKALITAGGMVLLAACTVMFIIPKLEPMDLGEAYADDGGDAEDDAMLRAGH